MAQPDTGEQLAYAMVTPYSLHKSRTGGIIARLLWADVQLVAARLYAPRPGSRFIEQYCDAIYDPEERSVPLSYQRLVIEYVLKNFGVPNVCDISNRLAVLIFRGPDAVNEIAEAAGHIRRGVPQGDTVRGTYGDYFREEPERLQRSPAFRARVRLLDKYERLYDADVRIPCNEFFEPGVLVGVSPEMTEAHLRLFRKCAYDDGGFVGHALPELDSPNAETSMVVLKPESFRNRNPLPGNLVDFFARGGMPMTGMKMLELGVEKARDFYALKPPQFRRQLKGMVGKRARQIVAGARLLAEQAVSHLGADAAVALRPANALAAARRMERQAAETPPPGEVKPAVVERIYDLLVEKLTDLEPPDAFYEELSEELKDLNAQAEFDELIRYMTGKDPATDLPLQPGEQTLCMAILYSGENALSVIRKRLKELRVVYGQNVLQNRAHASDPEEDPLKERVVLGMPGAPGGESMPCDVERIVTEFLGPDPKTP